MRSKWSWSSGWQPSSNLPLHHLLILQILTERESAGLDFTDNGQTFQKILFIFRNHGGGLALLSNAAGGPGDDNQKVTHATESVFLGLREDTSDTASPSFADK